MRARTRARTRSVLNIIGLWVEKATAKIFIRDEQDKQDKKFILFILPHRDPAYPVCLLQKCCHLRNIILSKASLLEHKDLNRYHYPKLECRF